MSIICTTERLSVREFELGDAEFIVRLLNEESFIRYIADKNVRTIEGAENYLKQGPIASYQQHGFGLNLVLIRETNTPIGMCGVLKRAELEIPDLGYAFLPEYCGQGYAKEAAEWVLKATMDKYQIETVAAVTLVENAASNRLLVNVGFEFQQVMELYGSPNNLYQFRI